MSKKKPPFPSSHPFRYANGPKVYTCSACGEKFEWSPESGWFGSIQEMDDGQPLIYACGAACFAKINAVLAYPGLPEWEPQGRDQEGGK